MKYTQVMIVDEDVKEKVRRYVIGEELFNETAKKSAIRSLYYSHLALEERLAAAKKKLTEVGVDTGFLV